MGLIAALGLVAAEWARRTNVHDYASRRSRIEWPAEVTLDRSALGDYLRHQFNVAASDDAEGNGHYSIRAGLCQLAGHGDLEPSDVLAAEATLLVVQQAWFAEFVERERPRLREAGEAGASLEGLRQRFVTDLAAEASFQADFPAFLEAAAAERDIAIRWARESSRDDRGRATGARALPVPPTARTP